MAKIRARLTLRRNGQITLPADIRRRVRAAEGDLFLASQSYFWTEAWQAGEREAQEDIRRGRVKRFRSAKALIADLQR